MIDARVANPPVCVRIVDGSVAMRTQREEVHTVAERVYGRLTVAPDADTAWGRVEGGALLAEGREYILPHWNGGAALEGALEAMLRASQSRRHPETEDARGSAFVLRADLISVEVRILLQSVARAVLVSRRGSLFEEVRRAEESETAPPRRVSFPLLARLPRSRKTRDQ
ncbi:MAG: hypothetical protein KGM44_09000, partial [bacterium]|nr:hypothetical protein [bacterium]